MDLVIQHWQMIMFQMIMPVVSEHTVGQKQMNYKFQPGFNFLEDKCKDDQQNHRKSCEQPLAWCFVPLTPSVQTCYKSTQSACNANFIQSPAYLIHVVGLSYNMKASIAVSLSNSSFSCCHRVSLNNNLCMKMVTSCKLCNLDHAMKVFYTAII